MGCERAPQTQFCLFWSKKTYLLWFWSWPDQNTFQKILRKKEFEKIVKEIFLKELNKRSEFEQDQNKTKFLLEFFQNIVYILGQKKNVTTYEGLHVVL